MSKILVVGGAGYIGSHVVKALQEAKHEVFILDNFCLGHREAAAVLGCTLDNGKLLEADLLKPDSLDTALQADGGGFDAVIHLAALSQVGESMQQPLMYYENNITGTLNLLKAMHQHGVKTFLFSSTAATYGNPNSSFTNDGKIPESHPTEPINPYGRTKLAIEWLLKDCAKAWGLTATALRYFNAAGNDATAIIGELHRPESHLIPYIMGALYGRHQPDGTLMQFKIFGDDYATPDGTCIRDYIHVSDLARAHVLAVERDIAEAGKQLSVYNVGTGRGFSVLEVVKGMEVALGREIPYEMGDRRAGDPDMLVADPSRIMADFGWKPERTTIDYISKDILKWTERLAAHSWNWPAN
ncbi:MAG: UDP-glucose 4-epimerase GalE [Alphaproteobacteria bacterium]|nr:UDP-glucose 4-epimerase GalE [Alphaproteobacteria bacterium]MDD9920652.1 UDP-glucose 4-epimerase GalE [Alphaproteobacteria bacterium]